MPNIPGNVKQPADRQKSAAEREAEGGGTAVVTWSGHEFVVPADVDDLPGEFLEAAEDGKATQMVRLVFGPKQFAEFRKGSPTVRDYREVGDQIAAIYGFGDSGN